MLPEAELRAAAHGLYPPGVAIIPRRAWPSPRHRGRREAFHIDGACFGLAFVVSIGSLARLVDIAKGKDPTLFVVLYTLGNVLGICGSFFLSGRLPA